MKATTVSLAIVLCSIPACFPPALAETPAAACLSANGQRLYNIRPFRNTPLPPGCRRGDTLVRFQLEQPGTTVRKLRNTLTAPGQKLLATLGDFEISQVLQGGTRPDRCDIVVTVDQDAFRLGGLPDGEVDIAVDGADFNLDLNFGDGQGEFNGSISGGPFAESQFFLADGSALFVDDVVVIADFGPVAGDGCFAAATVRFAADARSLYGP